MESQTRHRLGPIHRRALQPHRRCIGHALPPCCVVAWQFATQQGLNLAQLDILQRRPLRRSACRGWHSSWRSARPAPATGCRAGEQGLVRKRAPPTMPGDCIALIQPATSRRSESANRRPFASTAVAALSPAAQTALLQLIGELQRNERFPGNRACLSCRYFQPNRHADADAPHRCGLVDAPLPLRLLRLDCPEHDRLPRPRYSATTGGPCCR